MASPRLSGNAFSLLTIVTLFAADIGVAAISHNHPKALLPLECCSAMTPVHPYDMAPHRNVSENVPAQESKNCPFSVTPKWGSIKPGDSVELTIQSKLPDVYSFKGYVVMAFNRSNMEGRSIGSFKDVSDGRFMDCSRGLFPNNTVTHDDVANKTLVTVKWIAPEDFEGEVVFVATYVQNYYMFWVNVTGSANITVNFGPTIVSSPIAIVGALITLLTTRGFFFIF